MIIDSPYRLSDKISQEIEIQAKRKQENKYKLIGKILLVPGLTLWELNWKIKVLKKAGIIENKVVDFETKKSTKNKKCFYNPESYYFQAHCPRTAVKRANKIIEHIVGVHKYFKILNKQIVGLHEQKTI